MAGRDREAAVAQLREQAEALADAIDAALLPLLLVHPLSETLADNRRHLEACLECCDDVVFRDVQLSGGRRGLVLFVDGMVDDRLVEAAVIRPLSEDRPVTAGDLRDVSRTGEVVDHILRGDTCILIDGRSSAQVASVRGWEHRTPEEPVSEQVVRGPREGFVESLRTNTALLRRKVGSPFLHVEDLTVGRLTQTRVSIVYVAGVAKPELVREVRRRLQRIELDGVLESGYLEEYIEDTPFSPFPQVRHTERPDVVAAAVLEGRVAILTDGTPFALLVPTVFMEFLQSPEDYYERYVLATPLRWVRAAAFLTALLASPLYIAITTYHQEVLPTPLLVTVAASREGIPFPAFVEALIMQLSFEFVREAGVRMPRPVGQAVTIVGALVLGEAAVRAGVISAPMIITLAATAVASFAVPAFNAMVTVRLLTFPLMTMAAALGLFGIIAALFALLVHMAALRSFGIPYLSPLAPLSPQGLSDTAYRAPWWAQLRRPAGIAVDNRRQPAGRRTRSRRGPGARGRRTNGEGTRRVG
ncbi:MAG: spore germination protein [Clostridia bacterium]|nr:spore germination protein [Clostridia bacterium]